MTLHRRSFLVSGLSAAVAPLMADAGLAQQLRTVRVGIGYKAMSSGVINLFCGDGAGFAREQGIKLTDGLLGGGSQVMLALDRGVVDVGAINAAIMLPLYAKGEMPPLISFYEYTYPYKYDIAVKPDSPIKSYSDLRGKKIGVSRLSSSEYPVTRKIMSSLGIDPSKDVSWIAVGEDVTSGVALERGIIDALSYYDAYFGLIENAGIKLRYLPRPANVPMIGGLFIGARRDFVEKNRTACVAYGRTVAMASEFLLANPAAGARAFLNMYPSAAPRNVSPQEAVRQVVVAIERRIKLYRPPYPGLKMGAHAEQEWREEAEFANLDIKDFKGVYTNDLIDEINDFDRAKVIEAAKSFAL